MKSRSVRSILACGFFFFGLSLAQAVPTKGTLSHAKGNLTLTYAYLVSGPDMVTQKNIRRIVFSPTDLSAKLQACATMSCVDGAVTEGMIVDLDAGPRLNYWMVLNKGLVQYSGTQEPSSLKSTANDPKHVAGKLAFDDSASTGPKVDVDFDAVLVKQFTK